MNAVMLHVMVSPHARPSRQEAGQDPPLPKPATPQSAGMDLSAWIPEPILLAPMERTKVATGVCVAIPAGYEGQVRPRSGLAANHGVTVLNAPGTVDADYRGEVAVLLINLGDKPFTIQRGDRVAQLVICPVAAPVEVVRSLTLPATHRGEGGFGSTGV